MTAGESDRLLGRSDGCESERLPRAAPRWRALAAAAALALTLAALALTSPRAGRAVAQALLKDAVGASEQEEGAPDPAGGPGGPEGLPGESGFSVLTPNQDMLVWDIKEEGPGGNVTFLNGWLKVPLNHDALGDDEAPHVCLRVSARVPKTPAERGVMFKHCGGPGSMRFCANWAYLLDASPMAGEVARAFTFIGINQRGMPQAEDPNIFWDMSGNLTQEPTQAECPFKESNGDPVLPFPWLKCDEIYSYLTEGGGLNETDFDNRTVPPAIKDRFNHLISKFKGNFTGGDVSSTDLDMILTFLSHGSLSYKSAWVRNETFMRWVYRLTDLEHNMCVAAERFQLLSPRGNKSWNTLSFLGTQDLVHDIDVFRQAIGVEKLSLAGSSYGTAVAPAYATLFPERTDLMVVDGVIPPDGELDSFLHADSYGLWSVAQGILNDCALSAYQSLPDDHRCPLAPGASTKVHSMLDSVDATIATSAALSMYQAVNKICAAPFWIECLSALNELSSDSVVTENDSVVFCLAALPQPVYPYMSEKPLPSPEEWMGNAPTDRWDSFHAVHATDIPGRLTEEAFISWWRGSLEKFEVGTMRTVTYAANIGSWPLEARPMPPAGNTVTKALVIGNLHDQATDYSGSQQMRGMFPEGALMTWQGYGHCLQSSSSDPADSATQEENDKELEKCNWYVYNYLLTGELPDDGYTCIMAEPLNLGSSAEPCKGP